MNGQRCQFSDFRAEFFFRADGEKATSRAEPSWKSFSSARAHHYQFDSNWMRDPELCIQNWSPLITYSHLLNTYFKQFKYIYCHCILTYCYFQFTRHLSSSAPTPISEDQIQSLDDGTKINYCTTGKHKEAFSTLVKCLYKWHTFISRIFLKIGWVTV